MSVLGLPCVHARGNHVHHPRESYHLSRAEVQRRLADVVPNLFDNTWWPWTEGVPGQAGVGDRARPQGQAVQCTHGAALPHPPWVRDLRRGPTSRRHRGRLRCDRRQVYSDPSAWRCKSVIIRIGVGDRGTRPGPAHQWLRTEGYNIVRSANTATKEHGIDVVAEKDGAAVGFEAKGYPSRSYADPRRAHEVKRPPRQPKQATGTARQRWPR